MNTANIFKNGTFWNFWMQCAEPLCRLLLLIKIFDHTKVSWQYDVRCFFFMVYHCCPGIQRISACVTRINERRLNLINWIQILADIVLVEKNVPNPKKFSKEEHHDWSLFILEFLLQLNSEENSSWILHINKKNYNLKVINIRRLG